MALKYECPKCGRKFTEWGAEKLGYKCPNDQWCKHEGEDPELIVAGSQDESPSRKTSLKRSFRPRPKAVKSLAEEVEPASDEDEFDDEEDDALEGDDSDDTEEGDDSDGEDEPAAAAGDEEDDSDDDSGDGDSETLDEDALESDGAESGESEGRWD
jgi:hypothetical protein